MQEIKFYPMSEWPIPDESDKSFSQTVIVYGDKLNPIGLGYFDFEMGEWLHFAENNFLLKCWCYLPDPKGVVEDTQWEAIAPKGYQKPFLKR